MKKIISFILLAILFSGCATYHSDFTKIVYWDLKYSEKMQIHSLNNRGLEVIYRDLHIYVPAKTKSEMILVLSKYYSNRKSQLDKLFEKTEISQPFFSSIVGTCDVGKNNVLTSLTGRAFFDIKTGELYFKYGNDNTLRLNASATGEFYNQIRDKVVIIH